MSAYLQAQVDAEDVVGTMCEDGDFLIDMWEALADALSQGLLLDNSADAVENWNDQGVDAVCRNLDELTATLRARLEQKRFLAQVRA